MRPAARTEPAARRVGDERGTAVIEGVLALGLVLLVVMVAVQAAIYVHARSVAQAAAQEGARSAAVGGAGAGADRANAVLRSAGGVGERLDASAATSAESVTVSVEGSAPRVFPVGLLMPSIDTSASLPVERFPVEERRG